MCKNLRLLLVLGWVGLQMLSLAHLAEHKFETHAHNDHICQIYLHCEQGKDSAANNSPIMFAQHHIVFITPAPLRDFAQGENYRLGQPRAPPTIS